MESDISGFEPGTFSSWGNLRTTGQPLNFFWVRVTRRLWFESWTSMQRSLSLYRRRTSERQMATLVSLIFQDGVFYLDLDFERSWPHCGWVAFYWCCKKCKNGCRAFKMDCCVVNNKWETVYKSVGGPRVFNSPSGSRSHEVSLLSPGHPEVHCQQLFSRTYLSLFTLRSLSLSLSPAHTHPHTHVHTHSHAHTHRPAPHYLGCSWCKWEKLLNERNLFPLSLIPDGLKLQFFSCKL